MFMTTHSHACTPIAPVVAVASVCSPLEIGANLAPQRVNELADALTQRACTVINLGVVDTADRAVAAGRKAAESHIDAIAIVATSWYEDYLVIDLLEECNAPLLLWAMPGMETGALCGHQQLTAILHQLGHRYHSLYGHIADARRIDDTMRYLRACALNSFLRRARVGFAGHRVAGMTEVAVNELALKKSIGPRVVPIDLPILLNDAANADESHAKELWKNVVSRAGKCAVDESAGLESMKVYAAIKSRVSQHRLSALTIGCYPHLMGKVCLAASLLADEGVPLACEGDVNGAVGQMILTQLTGLPTHNTDWLDPLEDGSVVLTHCGSGSFDLAEDPKSITLTSVRLMGQGCCALFTAKPGPVTLINLMPKGDGYQCAMLTGQARSTEMVFPGNPLRVQFNTPIDDLLQWIHAAGVGHHWMAVNGHIDTELRHWASLAGSSLTLITP
jgi:L-fucose isomerase-like protein